MSFPDNIYFWDINAYLEVRDNTQVGAFLDWGLDKDVLVPFAEQHRPMIVGNSYIVFLYLDNKDRIAATSKIDKIVSEDDEHDFRPQQAVDLIIGSSTELGFKGRIPITWIEKRRDLRGYVAKVGELSFLMLMLWGSHCQPS